MPARDLHNKPFDEGTKTKLEIYRSYVRAWLQVFLHANAFREKPLQFFDFFCGPGEDSTGEPGSPVILINELKDVYMRLRDGGVLKNAKATFPRYSADAMESPRKIDL